MEGNFAAEPRGLVCVQLQQFVAVEANFRLSSLQKTPTYSSVSNRTGKWTWVSGLNKHLGKLGELT